jgi:hypothetical protein
MPIGGDDGLVSLPQSFRIWALVVLLRELAGPKQDTRTSDERLADAHAMREQRRAQFATRLWAA